MIPFDSQLLPMVFKAIGLLMQLPQDGTLDLIRQQADALIDEITSGLPAKPDGTAWTRDDITRMAADYYALSASIRARHSR